MIKEKRFCAFCKNPVTIYRKKHISILDFLYCTVLSLLVSYSLWQKIDPKFLIFLSLLVFCCEIFILFRWRIFVKCNHCGFDPILYKKYPEKMAPIVQKKMQERMTDNFYSFSNYKFDKLAKRKPDKDSKKDLAEQNTSPTQAVPERAPNSDLKL